MVQKLTSQKEEAARPKLSRILRNSLLAGAIALSGCAASAMPAQSLQTRSSPAPQKPLEIMCNGKLNYIRQFESLHIGATERASYKFLITGIEGDSVSADVSVPLIAVDGRAIASLSFRFNEVRFSRRSITDITETLCAEVEEHRRRQDDPELRTASLDGNLVAAPDASWAAVPGVSSADIGVLLKKILADAAVSKALAYIALVSSGRMGEGTEAAKFSLKQASAREFLLRIDEGYFSGREFRMDRRLDYAVDVAGPELNFAHIPMRISKLTAGKDSYSIELEIDCSRDMEIYMEFGSYSGPNPSCK